MKRKKMSIVVLMAVISTWTFPGYAIFGLTPFQEAYQKGADKKDVSLGALAPPPSSQLQQLHYYVPHMLSLCVRFHCVVLSCSVMSSSL